jgi:hypothetical protein
MESFDWHKDDVFGVHEDHSNLFELINTDFTIWNKIQKHDEMDCDEYFSSSDPATLYVELMSSDIYGEWSNNYISQKFENKNDKILKIIEIVERPGHSEYQVKTGDSHISLSQFVILPSFEVGKVRIAIISYQNGMQNIDIIITVDSSKITKVS